MANIKSQIKRNRQNEKRRVANRHVRSELRTRIQAAVTAAEEGSDDAAELTAAAVRRIDKAASNGVLHKNTASRKKSRLVRQVARLTADS